MQPTASSLLNPLQSTLEQLLKAIWILISADKDLPINLIQLLLHLRKWICFHFIYFFSPAGATMDWPQQRCSRCWEKTSHLKWRWSKELNTDCTNMGLRLLACLFHLPTAVVYGSLSLFVSILHNVFLLYYVDTFVSVYKIDKLSFWIGEVSFFP